MVIFFFVIFAFLGSVDNFNTKWTACDTNPSGYCAPTVAIAFFSALAFALGAGTSLVCGFLGKTREYVNVDFCHSTICPICAFRVLQSGSWICTFDCNGSCAVDCRLLEC